MNYLVFKPYTQEGKKALGFRTNVTHKWCLPGVRCYVCGNTWAQTGVFYPSIDLTSFPEKDAYKPRPQPLDEFERLRKNLAGFVPRGTMLVPGAQFGPIVGKASGELRDVIWPYPWLFLVQVDILQRLRDEGLRLPTAVPSELEYRGAILSNYCELEAHPAAYLKPGMGIREIAPCSGCGRYDYSLHKAQPLVLDSDTIPKNIDVFRLCDLPTYVICTEKFADSCVRFILNGTTVSPIPTSSDLRFIGMPPLTGCPKGNR